LGFSACNITGLKTHLPGGGGRVTITVMQVTVIGTGFVGVVTAAVFAHFKNMVYGLDVDREKVKKLRLGEVPFYEPQLAELVRDGIKGRRLTFTSDYKEAVRNAGVIIIAVGTPSAPDGTADLKYVFQAVAALAPHLKEKAIVAIKSTVPPGTNEKATQLIKRVTKKKFFMASLPEFLKEGSAVTDTLKPDRVVIGTNDRWVADRLIWLHRPIGGKRIVVRPESAQMAKYAANAYLAQRITFINQIANLCERNNADVREVVDVIGADKRIGSHYWYPGLGYGGSCFPKDTKELAAYSRSVGEGDGLFVKLDELNERRIYTSMEKFERQVNGWEGKTVALLGLSFKPNTDDLREAPSVKIIPLLTNGRAKIVAYDPKAMPLAKKIFPYIFFTDDAYQAVAGADVTMLLTEWSELTHLRLGTIKRLMRGLWFIDTRNQYDPVKVRATGLSYIGIGRV